nr:AAA family ATPase [Actinomycetota bacterium]
AWARDADARADLARERQRAGEAQLETLRARERELGQGLEEVARRRNAAEVRRAETRARAAAVAERALEEWGLAADDLVALGGLDPDEEAEARGRVEALDRQMKRLGTVNPRAAEEYSELAERETFLETQTSDLRASKRDLMAIVTEVDETIVEVFSQAFADVAAEFQGVIQRLFPGGSGELRLTNPDDVLTSGIEIEARPPGKNVRKLSLLSGGERSLVALAFLFSIFRSRPSPFYLLDEVEAALDDVNLQRFLGLVEELEERAQVLIVTHQKRTMEAADILYGVSMAKDGVSHVVAQRMEDVAVS